jgi:hypothetical protein
VTGMSSALILQYSRRYERDILGVSKKIQFNV